MWIALLFWMTLIPPLVRSAAFSTAPINIPPLLLQSPHSLLSPADTFRQLADFCELHHIHQWDMYGDFDKHPDESFVRRFEQEIAVEFGKEDAVFMPSGVMAQSIALLIHQSQSKQQSRTFACHSSCHLLLHENHAYRELLQMQAVILDTIIQKDSMAPEPLDYVTVQSQLSEKNMPSTLILEIPHRELGGKLTPWSDVERMRYFCRTHDIAFHCDGARLFEASAAFPHTSLADVAEPFDSVYLSCYKGLAGLSGAMLLGSKDFCTEARIWLRRLGGNLYTLLPYVVSAKAGYQKYWLLQNNATLSFAQKKEKLVRVVRLLQDNPIVSQVVRFEPEQPQVSMVHGYLFDSVEHCHMALDRAVAQVGMKALHRIRNVRVNQPFAVDGRQYQSMFEWNMGEANGQVDDAEFVRAWEAFARHLLDVRHKTDK